MKKLLLPFILLLLCSCSHTRYVPLPEHHTRDSTHLTTDHRYDSIYIDRWHTLILRGDTVFKTDSVYVEKIHEVEVHDTITVTRTDTVSVAVPCPSTGKGCRLRRERGHIPRVYRYSLWLVILFFLYLVFCIVKAVYLRR